MATINGCNLPEELYYLVEKHVWVRTEGADVITIGMNDVAGNLAGNVLSLTAKKVGKTVPKGQSVATIESAKWVGPVPAPVSGEIVAVNEDARKDPKLVNQDPYGQGWIVKLKPSNWEAEKVGVVTGAQGLEDYRAFLDKAGIHCGPAGA